MQSGMRRWRWVVHGAALLPLIWLVPAWFSINPIQALTIVSGTAALSLLVASLVCSPLSWFGWKWISAWRKPLGLYGFGYVCLHLAIYVILDYGLNWALLWRELSEKPYVMAGFSAFVLLVPLALTSTKNWQRRLGKAWRRLHRLVYLAVPIAVAHYWWAVKADWRIPALYGLIVAILLVVRLPLVRQRLTR